MRPRGPAKADKAKVASANQPKADAKANPKAPFKEVVAQGTVRFLYATPVLAVKGERNPSWILAQVGDARDGLTFLADPATERQLIEAALLDQVGRTLLDPKYRTRRSSRRRSTRQRWRSSRPTPTSSSATRSQRPARQDQAAVAVVPPRDAGHRDGAGARAAAAGEGRGALRRRAGRGSRGQHERAAPTRCQHQQYPGDRGARHQGAGVRERASAGRGRHGGGAGGFISAGTATITTRGDLINRGGRS